MYTIAETAQFISQVSDIWTDDERLEFFEFLAQNPLKGNVIPNAKGLRKIRYSAKGHGKRGGARVIYYNMLDDGLIVAVAIYPKNEREDLTKAETKKLAKSKSKPKK